MDLTKYLLLSIGFKPPKKKREYPKSIDDGGYEDTYEDHIKFESKESSYI